MSHEAMTEFDLGGHTYRIRKLPAMQQFHVHRRIAPLLPPLLPAFSTIVKQRKEGGNAMDFLESLAPLLQPVADALADLKDEHAEFVYGNCLSAVQRKDGKGWANIYILSTGSLMFQDIDAVQQIRMVVRVIQDSLGPFIQGLLTAQDQAAPAA